MTRAKVIQIGLIVFLLGGIIYALFRSFGLEDLSAGIASEAILILVVLVWTGSYLFRVVNGQMTFNKQRERYRDAYDQIMEDKLKEKFDELSEEEQMNLIKEIENDMSETK